MIGRDERNSNGGDDSKSYFEQPGLRRLVEEVRSKFDSRGASGNVTLEALSGEESEALSSLLERYYPPGRRATISLRRLESRLLESAFGCTIREMLENLDGRTVTIRSERKREKAEAWIRLLRDASAAAGLQEGGDDYAPIRQWLKGVESGVAAGSRTLGRMADADPVMAERQLAVCIEIVMQLWDRQRVLERERCMIRLPILAASATGNAHALDWQEPLGRLLVFAIQEVWGQRTEGDKGSGVADGEGGEAPADESALPGGALLRRELYRTAGIADDDMSSQVLFYAPLWTQDREERLLTLRQVERMDEVPKPSVIWAVENPSLFGYLLDRGLSEETLGDAMLVCVNGYPSSATLRWLDRCMLDGEGRSPELRYAGDLDVQGLEITLFLQQRYGDRFRAWRMSASDYERGAGKGLPLASAEKRRLEQMSLPWEETLIPVMLARGVKLHQEVLAESLWMDLTGNANRME
ncbi:DUF2399 domain-containing protein [Cohnella xylanilytica]|uniref:DUF2399 domain-containing protein n=1 Tax=Cohnella xylanilytica TaxID=557555 RepID=A0A841U6B5_9BACL|nr:TIGR02679 domain-containing protein [Cohnella xylanilytica]MBB6693581.1 DUF2399 domain-containing protein [Cohnella xylanilytica]